MSVSCNRPSRRVAKKEKNIVKYSSQTYSIYEMTCKVRGDKIRSQREPKVREGIIRQLKDFLGLEW